MIHIESAEQFDAAIIDGVTLVDFYATWCGPCRMIAPFIEEIDLEYKDKIKVAKIDVDECGEIASRYSVNAIPAILIFKNGELTKSNVGFIPKEELVKIIDSMLVE